MKLARLLLCATAATTFAGWATTSLACDKDKAAAASAAKASTCTAAMAAKCTPEMAAACQASMAAGAKGADHCAGMKASAVAASAGECPYAASMKSADHCAGTKTTAVAASASECSKASAVTAAAGGKQKADCCAKDAASASAKACAAKGMKISAAMDGHCSGTGMAGIAAAQLHDDCEACFDMTMCSHDLDAAGAHRQIVRLKNGLMLVYTADSPGKVSAVQAAVNARGEHLARFAAAGQKARLCDECKAIRAALASGKLTREVVNIEGGSLTLLTSSDPPTVARLHAMTDQKVAARIKS